MIVERDVSSSHRQSRSRVNPFTVDAPNRSGNRQNARVKGQGTSLGNSFHHRPRPILFSFFYSVQPLSHCSVARCPGRGGTDTCTWLFSEPLTS